MKFVMFKFNPNKKNDKRPQFEVERILFVAFIVIFSLMVIVQAMLATPAIRTFLVMDNELEGSPLEKEEYLYETGEMELELLNADYDENLKVLVNGDAVASFAEKKIKVAIKNGDVVEIDGTDTQEGLEVAIVSCSSNVESGEIGRKIRVLPEVQKLIKVKVE